MLQSSGQRSFFDSIFIPWDLNATWQFPLFDSKPALLQNYKYIYVYIYSFLIKIISRFIFLMFFHIASAISFPFNDQSINVIAVENIKKHCGYEYSTRPELCKVLSSPSRVRVCALLCPVPLHRPDQRLTLGWNTGYLRICKLNRDPKLI